MATNTRCTAEDRLRRARELAAHEQGLFATILYRHLSQTYWPHVPVPLQRVALSAAVLLMRLSGISKRYSVHFD